MNLVKNNEVKYISLGKMDYQEAWDYQTELFEGIIGTKLENRKKSEVNFDIVKVEGRFF